MNRCRVCGKMQVNTIKMTVILRNRIDDKYGDIDGTIYVCNVCMPELFSVQSYDALNHVMSNVFMVYKLFG